MPTYRIADETDWHRFKARVEPLLDEVVYCTLTDRSDREEEELLGRWPAEGAELPPQPVRAMWDWASEEVLALSHERGEPVCVRVNLYGPKGLKKLRSITIRSLREAASWDEEGDGDVGLGGDIPDPGTPGAELQGVALCERATALAINGSRGVITEALRVLSETLRVTTQQQRMTQEQLASINTMLEASRAQNGDFAEMILGLRLEQAEEAETQAKRSGKKQRNESGGGPSPIARDGLAAIKDLAKGFLLKQELPEELAVLLDNPRIKKALADPRLARALKNKEAESEMVEALEGLLDSLLDAVPEEPADPSSPPPSQDDDFDV